MRKVFKKLINLKVKNEPLNELDTIIVSFLFSFLLLLPVLRYVYWGEYPLSFAACLGQEESYRLMLAKGANPDNQDTNGNTALHMLVIHNKLVSSHFCFIIYFFNFSSIQGGGEYSSLKHN